MASTSTPPSTPPSASSAPELPEPIDLSHHLTRTTLNREASSVKQFYKFFAIPGIAQLAGGLPNDKYMHLHQVSVAADSHPVLRHADKHSDISHSTPSKPKSHTQIASSLHHLSRLIHPQTTRHRLTSSLPYTTTNPNPMMTLPHLAWSFPTTLEYQTRSRWWI